MPTAVASTLPMLNLAEGATFTVDTGEAAAHITQLVVHVWQDVPTPFADPLLGLPPYLVHAART